VDHAFRVEDAEFLPVLFDLVEREGLSLGGSSGVNIVGAMRLAEALGPDKTIVTLLCDPGSRYVGRLYNADYLAARNLPVPPWSGKPPHASMAK
jgi:cysteine synthase A